MATWAGIEGLEDRTLMSAVMHFGRPGRALNMGAIASGTAKGVSEGARHAATTFTVAQMTSAVQTGLTTLATNAGLTLDTASTVRLSNVNGTALYSVTLKGTGTVTTFTVDATGAAYAAPTRTTTTFGALANTAVTTELTAIATALNLTAPTSTTSVSVVTSGTSTIYTVNLTSTTSSGKGRGHSHGVAISVDANGNPVGNTVLPLGVLPTAVQNGLTANAPSGATALTSTSPILVRTLYGVTTYTATYTASGTKSLVSVDTTGALATLPTSTKSTFADVSSTVQSALQTYATDAGVTGSIDTTTAVNVFSLGNGTTLYTIRLSVSKTASDGTTYTVPLLLTVDQNGNLTVMPTGGACH